MLITSAVEGPSQPSKVLKMLLNSARYRHLIILCNLITKALYWVVLLQGSERTHLCLRKVYFQSVYVGGWRPGCLIKLFISVYHESGPSGSVLIRTDYPCVNLQYRPQSRGQFPFFSLPTAITMCKHKSSQYFVPASVKINSKSMTVLWGCCDWNLAPCLKFSHLRGFHSCLVKKLKSSLLK